MIATGYSMLRRWLRGWLRRNKNPVLFATVIALAWVAFLLGKLLGEGPPKGQWWFGGEGE